MNPEWLAQDERESELSTLRKELEEIQKREQSKLQTKVH
jgi:hypothetical protein